MSDEELMRMLAISGSIDAFEKLVERYQQRVVVYFRKNEASEPESCSQEVFLRVFRYRESFRGQCLFVAWLFKIAGNYLIDVHRRESTDAIGHSSFLEDGHAENQSGKDLKETEAEDERLELRRAVEALPLMERQVIELRYFKRLSQEAAARSLGISLMRLRTLEYGAIARLRRMLDSRVRDLPFR